jgi:NAD+ synthase
VRGVLLPSPYTSKNSNEDALELAKNLGIETQTIPITPAMETMQETLDKCFALSLPLSRAREREASVSALAGGGINNWMENVSIGGNLQARLRGVVLMALSNQSGFMLLSTGNKSEIAVGYSTLYGDSCGGYNVLKDLYKTQVYELANWRNQYSVSSSVKSPHPNLLPEGEGIKPSPFGRGLGEGPIPIRSITKAPTAELKSGQTDQDQLPPYDILDAILALHIEGRLSEKEIVNNGFDTETVSRILKLVRVNEYKRRQSCPGVKLSPMLFGKDRRYPLTNRYQS